jgi:hypothetical protein
MAVLPVSVSAAPRPDAAAPVAARVLPRWGTPRFVPAHTFLFRCVVAAGLTAVAFLPVYAELVTEALNGSRSAYLVIVPVLLAVIAAGYRVPPKGVGDVESDWIVAAVVGVVGFSGIHLMSSPPWPGCGSCVCSVFRCGWAAWPR